MFGFEHLVGVAIGWDGSWHLIKSAGNAFCEAKWPEVWAGKYRGLGGVNDIKVELEGMVVEKGQRASSLAEKMLEGA
ncbi:hypothetical protein E8E13_009893 [Curvularia kusanoi]|uniref:Uncharacterized protein n=1 Tax=Curvularia kusanoi TaxID=90978 RepID=A0A9P4TE24_CURKU|nr:hypothetical protein E8E13_009893 [Curvularia kusanoi]